MTTGHSAAPGAALVRQPAVAGTFYPWARTGLAAMVDDLYVAAARLAGAGAAARTSTPPPVGLLVPHAGLTYSGVVAAAGWSALAAAGPARDTDHGRVTVVILGTNHGAGWLEGVGAWDAGAWRTPLGDVSVDGTVADAIVGLGPPFLVDLDAHDREHSIEVQLPLLQGLPEPVGIVPLAVSAGIGDPAIDAGGRLGALLARLRAEGTRIVLAISSDMAHYPPAPASEEVTEALLPSILAVDAAALAAREAAIRSARIPGLVCGMCGIEPSVLGLAALRAMSLTRGTTVAAATSADAGGPLDRTVGYLAVRFDP
jgi:AmmeMemoRadiSam system protein B